MIRPHRDLVVGPALIAPTGLLIHDRADQSDHVDAAVQMLALVEGAAGSIALPQDVPQMQEVHAVAEASHHARQIIVGAGTKSARA